jgi:hypothetical protein
MRAAGPLREAVRRKVMLRLRHLHTRSCASKAATAAKPSDKPGEPHGGQRTASVDGLILRDRPTGVAHRYLRTAGAESGRRCRDQAQWSAVVNVRAAVGTGVGFAVHLPVVAAVAMAYYNKLPFDAGGHGISGLVMVAVLGELILAVACAGTGGVLLGVERRAGLGAGLLIGWAAGLLVCPAVACGLLAVWP